MAPPVLTIPREGTHRLSWDAHVSTDYDDQGWAHHHPTGDMTVTCCCGFTTGVVPRADALAQGRQHAHDHGVNLT